MSRFLSIFLFSVLFFCITGCSRNSENSLSRLDSLDAECREALMKWDYEKSDSISAILLNEAKSLNNIPFYSKALYYQGTFRPDLSPELLELRENNLQVAESLAINNRDRHLLAIVYNAKAIWQAVKHKNYPLSQYYLSKAIEIARETHDRVIETSAESNYSEMCRLIGDTLGFKYDLDLFNYAGETGNNTLLISSAFHCSENLIKTGSELEKIEPFVAAIKRVDESNSLIPLIYADYWVSRADFPKAFERIMESDYENSYLEAMAYAEIQRGMGNFQESNRMASKVVTLFQTSNFDDQWIRMFNIMADNYADMNRFDSAYYFQSRYNNLVDSISSRRNQDRISQLKIEYEVDKKDREINFQKERSEKVIAISIAGGLIFFIIIITIVFYLRKRNLLFQDIVKQNRDHFRIESELQQKIDYLQQELENKGEKEEDSQSALSGDSSVKNNLISEDKAEEIFERIKKETEENEIWRSPTITRESFADLVGCNRTYFSEVIKSKTGMSYSQYMNQFRIREVLRILSKKDSEIVSLPDLASSVGFTSLSNFYSIFKQSVGLSPAAYIKTLERMNKE